MKKSFKKWLAYGLATTLFVTAMSDLGALGNSNLVSAAEGNDYIEINKSTTADITVPDAPAEFRDLTAEQIIQETGIGWNLGNTLDAWTDDNFLTGETLWQNVTTTKALIKSVHDMGFNTLRLPVTWGANINDDYSVDEEWMSRVQEVVDYAISEDMYVMLNVHHDGCRNDDPTPHGWLNVDGSDEDFEVVRNKFNGLWSTIAERFKNYDEHLMFAAMNEVFGDDPLLDGNDKEHNFDCLGWKPQYGYNEAEKELLLIEYERIAALNQDFVDVVRSSGGNNDQRWIIVQPHNTSIFAVFDEELGFEMPTDTAERVMMEVHDYDSFTVDKSMNENQKDSYAQQFARLKETYVDNGIPVVIGEFGFKGTDKRCTKFEGVGYLSKKYSMIGCVWDNNGAGDYQVVDRVGMKPSDICVAALMRGFFDITEDAKVGAQTETVPMTELKVDTTSVEVEAGKAISVSAQASAPADTNDTIVWSTSDANIASVSNGKIQGNTPGTATITAKALSGTAAQEISVTVTPKELDDPTTEITVNYESLELSKGQEVYLTAETNNSEKVTYISDNETVANVSCDGRILAKDNGSANIKLVTADGYSKTIAVQVGGAVIDPGDIAEQLRLVIRAQYNSGSDDTYYGGSLTGSEYITITSDGTYTLSLDTAVDLPDEAKNKGVTNLNGLGALYIYDYDVATHVNKKSAIPADTRVSYSSIKINDVELLSKETEDYKAVKGSIFDTGNPFNAWDGSVVPEDKFSNNSYSITFPDIENPSKIEITFTVKGYREKVIQTAAPTATVTPSTAPTAPTATVAPTQAPAENIPAKNTKVTSSGSTFVVTSANASGGEVAMSKAKNAKTVNVPDTVTVSGKKYKVTSIKANAFKGNKKLTSVTIGKNVKSIGKNAFNSCKKLTKVTVKSTVLKSIGAKAFAQGSKKITVTVPKKKAKAYIKLFKKSGISKKVKYKKK